MLICTRQGLSSRTRNRYSEEGGQHKAASVLLSLLDQKVIRKSSSFYLEERMIFLDLRGRSGIPHLGGQERNELSKRSSVNTGKELLDTVPPTPVTWP